MTSIGIYISSYTTIIKVASSLAQHTKIHSSVQKLNATNTNYINDNAVQDVTNSGLCNKYFVFVTCKQTLRLYVTAIEHKTLK